MNAALLVGTWMFTEDETVGPSNFHLFGPRPKGCLMFTDHGRYSVLIADPRLKPFASSDRLKATDEEMRVAMRGTYAHFGSYTVDEARATFTLQAEASTFPNDVGVPSVREVTSLTADTLKFTNPTPPSGDPGSKAFVTLRRFA